MPGQSASARRLDRMMCVDCASRLLDAAGTLADVAEGTVETLDSMVRALEAGETVTVEEIGKARQRIESWRQEFADAADVVDELVTIDTNPDRAETWH